ncbi:cytochrome P450 [Dichomitus squalens]|uniref:Cytochrome P450 n=1 Tax=Dichomitus squalens TaxID=114155 RepID=A0A4Q9MW25_9APHY|nr:cytochrome P450 [Dichomitus squalens]TBU37120.1 cytochrome P450 [Dichomitus squalens]TBU51313.1 cytochrome P450 [Dichomitus squalens]
MASVLLLFAGAVVLLLVRILKTAVPRWLSPFGRLRGPPRGHVLFGNLLQIGSDHPHLHTKWFEEYGPTIRVFGIFNFPWLYTTDLRLINHILTHSMEYFKPEESRKGLSMLLGQGVLVTEGETHRHQRRIMNPAFGPGQIRGLTEIFLEKANNLCEYWNYQVASSPDETLRTNVMDGLSKMTLDVIGLAGFNYEFDALNPDKPPNELNRVFAELFKTPPPITVGRILKDLVPFFSRFRDDRTKKTEDARETMQRIGMRLLQEKKAEIQREYGEKGTGAVEKKDLQGRDLLTILIKANMATDIPDDQKLTDEEVVAQVPTFLVAGHETTSTATTWCLYALCKHPEMQQKLREELLAVATDTPTMEDLNALPYLDLIIRESLRLYAPVTLTSRVAVHDDVLPLSEPITDKNGNVLHEIPIRKKQRIVIPILALQTSKRIWGEDAFEFKPERWEHPPEAIAAIPGVWSHLLTFLGGPHACIGYRFSLVEMKALVFTLIRRFEFELAVPAEQVVPQGQFLQRPAVTSDRKAGAQLPLIIRAYKGV